MSLVARGRVRSTSSERVTTCVPPAVTAEMRTVRWPSVREAVVRPAAIGPAGPAAIVCATPPTRIRTATGSRRRARSARRAGPRRLTTAGFSVTDATPRRMSNGSVTVAMPALRAIRSTAR